MQRKRLITFFIVMIAVIAFFVIFNFMNYSLISKFKTTGEAFYMSESGLPAFRTSYSSVPNTMLAINTVAWTGVLIAVILLLYSVRAYEKELIEKYNKKNKKKSKRKTKKK